jgi:hypothetical protein
MKLLASQLFCLTFLSKGESLTVASDRVPSGAITRRWATRRHCREANIVLKWSFGKLDVAEKRKKGRRSLKRTELILRSLGWKAGIAGANKPISSAQLDSQEKPHKAYLRTSTRNASMTFATLTGQWEELIFTCRPRKIFS